MLVRTAMTRSPRVSRRSTASQGSSRTPRLAAAADRAAQVPGISNLGTVGQKVDQPQLRVQGRLDPKAIAGSQPLMDNALDTPPAGRGLELMLLGNRPGDIDSAATAITVVNARLLAQRGRPTWEQLGAPGPQLHGRMK